MAQIFDPSSKAPAALAPVPTSPTSEDSVESGEGAAVKISRYVQTKRRTDGQDEPSLQIHEG